MKTCKTCGYFDDGLQVCELKSKDKWHCVLADDKACDDWTLGYEALLGKASESLKKAREKHPDFVPPLSPSIASTFAICANAAKRNLEEHGTLDDDALSVVLFSEVYEFLVEVARGDFDRALEEAGDVIAVMYRALNGECKKEESK